MGLGNTQSAKFRAFHAEGAEKEAEEEQERQEEDLTSISWQRKKLNRLTGFQKVDRRIHWFTHIAAGFGPISLRPASLSVLAQSSLQMFSPGWPIRPL
jgi:hypothetical protein